MKPAFVSLLGLLVATRSQEGAQAAGPVDGQGRFCGLPQTRTSHVRVHLWGWGQGNSKGKRKPAVPLSDDDLVEMDRRTEEANAKLKAFLAEREIVQREKEEKRLSKRRKEIKKEEEAVEAEKQSIPQRLKEIAEKEAALEGRFESLKAKEQKLDLAEDP